MILFRSCWCFQITWIDTIMIHSKFNPQTCLKKCDQSFQCLQFLQFFLRWTLNIEQKTYIWIYVHAYILLNLSISIKINSINLLNELKEAKVFVNYEFCVCYGTALLEPPSKIPFQFLVSAWISRYKCRKIIIIIASIFDGKRLNICLHISWTYSNIDLRLWHLFQNKQSFWIDFIFFLEKLNCVRYYLKSENYLFSSKI